MKARTILLSALLLSACGALVPGTAARMANFSPIEANPEAITIVLVIPQGLRLRENGAKLELQAQNADTGEAFKGAYTLAEKPANAVDFGDDQGGDARFYSIRPADAHEMRKAQAQIKAWKEAGPDNRGSGSLGIGFDGCKTGAGPASDARLSAYIRLDPAAAFMPLIQKAKLSNLLGDALIAQLKPCEGAR